MKDRIVYVVYSHSRVQLGRLCFLGWGDTKEDAMIDAYGDLEAFGPERHAQEKNVAEPLRFRAMR